MRPSPRMLPGALAAAMDEQKASLRPARHHNYSDNVALLLSPDTAHCIPRSAAKPTPEAAWSAEARSSGIDRTAGPWNSFAWETTTSFHFKRCPIQAILVQNTGGEAIIVFFAPARAASIHYTRPVLIGSQDAPGSLYT